MFYLIIIIISLNACKEETDCVDCQAALDHMHEKILQMSCNPSYMANAWSKINENCGNLGNEYVGYMAEQCNIGNSSRILCKDHLTVDELRLGFQTEYIPDTLAIIVKYKKSMDTQWDLNINRYNYKELKVSGLFHPENGDDFEFIIQNARTDEIIASETKRLTWARTDEWWSVRTLKFEFTEQSGYSWEFISW